VGIARAAGDGAGGVDRGDGVRLGAGGGVVVGVGGVSAGGVDDLACAVPDGVVAERLPVGVRSALDGLRGCGLARRRGGGPGLGELAQAVVLEAFVAGGRVSLGVGLGGGVSGWVIAVGDVESVGPGARVARVTTGGRAGFRESAGGIVIATSNVDACVA